MVSATLTSSCFTPRYAMRRSLPRLDSISAAKAARKNRQAWCKLLLADFYRTCCFCKMVDWRAWDHHIWHSQHSETDASCDRWSLMICLTRLTFVAVESHERFVQTLWKALKRYILCWVNKQGWWKLKLMYNALWQRLASTPQNLGCLTLQVPVLRCPARRQN